MILESASVSRKGTGGHVNEDRLLDDVERGMFAVADGIGGADHGEVASSTAIECLKRTFVKQSRSRPALPVDQRLRRVFLLANRVILRAGLRTGRQMGTTLTAVVVKGATCYLAHSGDSRAYVVVDGVVRQLTEDNTLVAELVRRGIITETEADSHPHRNVLTGCLGLHQHCKIQIETCPLTPGGKLVLCTDGVSDCLAAEEIGEYLKDESLSSNAETLVSSALSRGSTDDLTVVVIGVGSQRSPVTAIH